MNRLLALGILVLAACTSGRNEAPSDLLDRETFIDALTQAQLIEARNNHEMVVEHRTDGPMVKYYDELFAEKGITKQQFTATYDHYTEDPKELKAIYEEVLTRLTRIKDEGLSTNGVGARTSDEHE
ncbi:MAG: DUF4296 domain-containing protein [Flavobacteriales bacterium]|nr:DUF4296 domain-containing protein [Flavobacteriales bacterium]